MNLMKWLLGTAAALALCACGQNYYQPAGVSSFQPVMQGVPGQCYYVDSPLEVSALIAAGLCQQGWQPVVMPLSWHEQYAYWLDSDYYTNRFIPVSQRTYYRTTVVTTFTRTYSTQIASASASAKYRGPNGQTLTGTQVQQNVKAGKANFGAGPARQVSNFKPTTTHTGAPVATSRPVQAKPPASRSAANFGGGSRSLPPSRTTYGTTSRSGHCC